MTPGERPFRPLPWALAVAAGALAGYGVYAVVLAGSCESSPTAPGVKPCPPQALWGGGALLLGIVGAAAVLLAFGFAPALWTPLLATGAALLGVAVTPSFDGPRLALGLGGVVVLVVSGALLELAGTRGSLPTRRGDVVAAGRDAVVTVLGVEEVEGTTLAGTCRVRLRVRVQPRGGDEYESEETRVMPRLPMIGERFPVRIDPTDPHRWVELGEG